MITTSYLEKEDQIQINMRLHLKARYLTFKLLKSDEKMQWCLHQKVNAQDIDPSRGHNMKDRLGYLKRDFRLYELTSFSAH